LDELKQEAARGEIEADKANALAQLEEGVSVSEVANDLGKRWATHELITRMSLTPAGAANVLRVSSPKRSHYLGPRMAARVSAQRQH